MEFTPDADDELQLDVRCVSVIWREDEDLPVVDFTSCNSAFEAISLLRGAARALEGLYPVAIAGYDYDDDE